MANNFRGLLFRSTWYSSYVTVLISWADTEGSPESSLNSNRQQFVKFRGTLRIVTGTHAGGQMGWPGMPWTLDVPQLAMLLIYAAWSVGHAQLTVLSLSNNQLYSGCTVRRGHSSQYYTKPLNSSPPSAPLYNNKPGEFRSPGSTPTYSSPDTLPQIHWGCALGQKDTARPQCCCGCKKAANP